MSRFAKYAWFVLAYNVVVILWGVFLRASKSGDGCGQHWLTCHGEVIPSAPELKTIIEFSHRLTSGIAFFAVLILLIWAFRKFEKGSAVRTTVLVSFIFIITEALVGAGLVLTGNTAETVTAARPFWAVGHLINTFILLAFLSLTAWVASGRRHLKLHIRDGSLTYVQATDSERKILILSVIAVVLMLLVGVSGSVAALSSMLFPSATVAEGIAQDFSPASNILVRLRVWHPILAILTSVYLLFLTGWLKTKFADSAGVAWWANILSILILIQIAFGAVTLLTLAPIIMQLGHLFLADAIWISFVLMCSNFLAENSEYALIKE